MVKRTSKCKHDLTDKVFGYWTVLGLSENQDNTYGDTRWTCKCRCGAIKDVLGNPLLRGDSKSCGCYKHYRCFNDDKKRAYCKEHGYPLLEISYKEDSFGLIRDCVSNFISTVEE